MLVKATNDVWVFTFIAALTSVLGGFSAMFIIRFKDGLKIHWKKYSELKIWIKDAFPFFLSTVFGTLKEQSLVIILGTFFSLKDVAIYDLAKKVISLPNIIVSSINGALYPKIVVKNQSDVIKKIIWIEALIALIIIAGVVLFGEWLVVLLGGTEMSNAYFIAIILSFTILAHLLVGTYIYFVFIPKNKFYYVTKNQLVAMISFFIYAFVGFLFDQSIYMFVLAMSLSGMTELLYCYIVIKKNNMLR